jgi:hypothetical protein
MELSIENIIPVIIIGAIVATLYFNTGTPTVTPNGYTMIQPKREIELIRGVNDAREEDNKVTINHVDLPEDKLNLLLWRNHLVFPRNTDGSPAIPTRKNADGTESPIWKISVTSTEHIFDPGWDFGAYAGYLGGPKEGTDIKDFDVGLRVSPLRIWNTFAPDALISNQAAGLGISFYPAPERFGEFWSNLGVGVGRVISYDDDCQRNIYYASFTTRF